MIRTFKRALSILVVCTLVLTTNSVATLADGLNFETTLTIEEETTIEETTETTEEITEHKEEPEDETTVEETEEETSIEETSEEETTVDETTAEETTAEDTTAEEATAEDTTAEETTAEETTAGETTAEETTVVESSVVEALLGDPNYQFKYYFVDADSGWFDAENGQTEIIYNSNDISTNPVQIPKIYLPHDATYVNYGWEMRFVVPSDPTPVADDVILDIDVIQCWPDSLPYNLFINPAMHDVTGLHSIQGPTKTEYNVGEAIDPAGLIMTLTVNGPINERDVAYDAPEFGSRMFDVRLYNASDVEIPGAMITAETKLCKVHSTRSFAKC